LLFILLVFILFIIVFVSLSIIIDMVNKDVRKSPGRTVRQSANRVEV